MANVMVMDMDIVMVIEDRERAICEQVQPPDSLVIVVSPPPPAKARLRPLPLLKLEYCCCSHCDDRRNMHMGRTVYLGLG